MTWAKWEINLLVFLSSSLVKNLLVPQHYLKYLIDILYKTWVVFEPECTSIVKIYTICTTMKEKKEQRKKQSKCLQPLLESSLSSFYPQVVHIWVNLLEYFYFMKQLPGTLYFLLHYLSAALVATLQITVYLYYCISRSVDLESNWRIMYGLRKSSYF